MLWPINAVTKQFCDQAMLWPNNAVTNQCCDQSMLWPINAVTKQFCDQAILRSCNAEASHDSCGVAVWPTLTEQESPARTHLITRYHKSLEALVNIMQVSSDKRPSRQSRVSHVSTDNYLHLAAHPPPCASPPTAPPSWRWFWRPWWLPWLPLSLACWAPLLQQLRSPGCLEGRDGRCRPREQYPNYLWGGGEREGQSYG